MIHRLPLILGNFLDCWLSVSKCTGDPKGVGTYRDMWGENHQHAADNETMCFRRAVSEWKYCGSHSGEQVMAVYGPTGMSVEKEQQIG